MNKIWYSIVKLQNSTYGSFCACPCETCNPKNSHFDECLARGNWEWYERFDDKEKFSSKAINNLPDCDIKLMDLKYE